MQVTTRGLNPDALPVTIRPQLTDQHIAMLSAEYHCWYCLEYMQPQLTLPFELAVVSFGSSDEAARKPVRTKNALIAKKARGPQATFGQYVRSCRVYLHAHNML